MELFSKLRAGFKSFAGFSPFSIGHASEKERPLRSGFAAPSASASLSTPESLRGGPSINPAASGSLKRGNPLAPVAKSASPLSFAAHARESTGADGLTAYERLQVFEAHLKSEFGLDEKLATVSGGERAAVLGAFSRYRAEKIGHHSMNSLEPIVAQLPVVAAAKAIGTSFVKGRSAKAKKAVAAENPSGLDDDGVPQKTEPTDSGDDDYELSPAEIIDVISELLKDLEQLLGAGAENVDQSEAASARAAAACGDHARAINHLWSQVATTCSALLANQRTISARYNLGTAAGPSSGASASPFQKLRSADARLRSAAAIPTLDLPSDPSSARPSRELNEKYRAALASLDDRIKACADDGLIPHELLRERRRVDQDWIALNRRKN